MASYDAGSREAYIARNVSQWSDVRRMGKERNFSKDQMARLRKSHVAEVRMAAREAGMTPRALLKLRDETTKHLRPKNEPSFNAAQKPAAATATKTKSGPGPWGMSNERAAKMRAQVAKVKPAATKGGARAGGGGGGGG